MDAIINKVNELNKKAEKIDSRLFLFDDFCPKTMPFNAAELQKTINELNALSTSNSIDISNEISALTNCFQVSGEIRFWYLIINLYGLFYDAGKYILRSNLRKTDNYEVQNFYHALNEVRSIFCHNKTPGSYLGYRIANNKLDNLVRSWSKKTSFCKSKWSSWTPAQWDDLYDLFYDGAVNALNKIEQNMGNIKPFDWFKAIADWYSSNDEVLLRAMRAYLISNMSIAKFKKPNDIESYLAYRYPADQKRIKGQISKAFDNNNSYTYLDNYLSQQGYCISPLNLLLPFLDKYFKNTPLPRDLQ